MRAACLGVAGFCFVLVLPLSVSAADDLRLVEAVQRRDQQGIRALLKQRIDVNVAQPDGATALAWAAHWDDLETAELLLRAGADANAANDLAVTPLMLAALNGSAGMVEKLLEAGADPNAARASGETALVLAARSGSAGAVKMLVANGADVNARTKTGDTALMFASAESHPDIMKVLIEGGADIKARAQFRKIDKPRMAAPVDLAKVKERLLQKNQAIAVADIPKDGDTDPPRPEGGFTSLLHAAMAGNLEGVRLLLDAGANIDEPAPDGTTPLILAINKHRENVALFLLDKGADPNPVEAGYTALHSAAATGQIAVAKALLSRGANPDAGVTMPLRLSSAFIPYNPELVSGRLSQVGATPFMLAAKSVDTKMMRLLVEGGANPKLKAKDGTTALILAAGLGKRSLTDMFVFIKYYTWDEPRAIEAIELCLDLGLNINDANEFGETALHGATYHAALQVIQFLAARGANLDAANWADQTPLRLAQGHLYSGTFVRYPEAAELLRKLGADPAVGTQLNFGITGYVENKADPQGAPAPRP
jgi:ankyrin repeat protein